MEHPQDCVIGENNAAQPKRHDEHHHPHADADPEQAGESAQHAHIGARRRQQKITRPRRAGGDDRKEQERDRLLRCHDVG